eukprot:NODE_112_length_19362_cov_0.399678.p11 type:complete len:111 gc:universal NODE_112_length_19362_cov_0.399678:14338-14006(-)
MLMGINVTKFFKSSQAGEGHSQIITATNNNFIVRNYRANIIGMNIFDRSLTLRVDVQKMKTQVISTTHQRIVFFTRHREPTTSTQRQITHLLTKDQFIIFVLIDVNMSII